MTEALLQHFAATNGLLVTTVNETSLAARAGLQAGDVITLVGERKVTDVTSFLQALDASEKTAQLSLIRRRGVMTLALNR